MGHVEKWNIYVHDRYKPITYATETYYTENEAEKAATGLAKRYPHCHVMCTYIGTDGLRKAFNRNRQYEETAHSW